MAVYKILLVDDDKFILASLQRALRKEKEWQLGTFHDPMEALEHARDQHYDLFISDYRMPGINGIEFLAEVKSLQPASMRIILSGDNNAELVQQAIEEAGVHHFVSKPVQQDQLITIINEAFECYENVSNSEI